MARVTNSHAYTNEGPDLDFSDLKGILHANGLFERNEIQDTELFSMFGYLDPFKLVGSTREFVFFTKPDLYIMDPSTYELNSGTNIPIFRLAQRTWMPSLKDLQYYTDQSKPFSAILYNHRISNIEVPNLNTQEIETAENQWGNKVYYRRSSTATADEFDFSVEFRDNKYLDAYMFFRLYDIYEERKAYGVIPLYDHNHYRDYILNRRLHDQMAVFKFIVGDDGVTLVYWVKYYGVYPKDVPRAAFGDMPEDGNFKFSISFRANYVEDMDPAIIRDYNNLAARYYGGTLPPTGNPLYHIDGYVRNEFNLPPFINLETDSNGKLKYTMQWR